MIVGGEKMNRGQLQKVEFIHMTYPKDPDNLKKFSLRSHHWLRVVLSFKEIVYYLLQFAAVTMRSNRRQASGKSHLPLGRLMIPV